MKTRPILFVLLATLGSFWLSAGCGKPESSSPKAEGKDVAYYTCSMHPQIHSDKPGNCPICGMTLTPVRNSGGAFSSDSKPSKTTVIPDRKIEYYTCSMHPKIRADKPGDCPICGMALISVFAPVSGGGLVAAAEVRLTEEGIRQAGVRTDSAQKRKLAKEILIFGTLGYDLNRYRDVTPLVEGRVEKQFLDFNQTEVKKGDPLVSLYSPEALRLQADYLKALREKWGSTFYEKRVLDSLAWVASEKLQRIGFSEDAIKRLEDGKKPEAEVIIHSPLTGTVVGNMIRLGEMVKADQALYRIVLLDELWFNGQVFESDIGLLKMGEKIRITTKSFPGEEFSGKLTFVGRSVEASNRTIPVRFLIPNPDHRLLPNLSASGVLEVPLGEFTLSVPNSAVLDLGTRHVIYVEKEIGTYLQKDVKIGYVTPHYIQILEGTHEGEKVVTAGAFLIDAQSQLRGNRNNPTVGEGSLPTHENPPHSH